MAEKTRTPIIIDTDPGVDDTVAMDVLLAITSPELEILAYIISFGPDNIYKLYQAIGRHIALHPEDAARFPNFSPIVPPLLVVGPEGPLEGGRHFAQYFHGRDGLSDINERHPELNIDFGSSSFSHNFQPVKESSVEVALRLLESRPDRSITYVVLGPMTNLAQLVRQHRQTVMDKIGRVIAMAGALDVPGNTTSVAECKHYVFADPYAAKELLVPTDPTSGLPLDRVHELPFPFIAQKVDPAFKSAAQPSNADGKSPLVHFTSSFSNARGKSCSSGEKDALELHDIVDHLAFFFRCANSRPPPLQSMPVGGLLPGMSTGWAVAERTFDIERTGEITRGMFVTDRREENTAYAPGANRAEVQAQLDLRHLGHGLLESTALPAR
ncbi:nucleoside hydrolase, partial [Suillus subalutaceus]|uniref:nucleoside hydrolase n=1 Tax=Suillus subalutaceus TaxID=48586 RepID=UPI001B873C13